MDHRIQQTSLGPVSYRSRGQGSRKILLFHGFPGSSLQIQMFEPHLQAFDLEVLCFDRPGYNLSKIRSRDQLKDSLQIASEMLQSRNWSQVEVVTVSGGTPFALSWALQNPNSVKNMRVICGLGDMHRPDVRKNFSRVGLKALHLLPYVPGLLLQKAINPQTRAVEKPKRNPVMDFFLPASVPDMEMFLDPKVSVALNTGLQEALSWNAIGPKQDAKVFTSNWSRNIADLKIPIHFWHGDLDQVIHPQISFEMSKVIPQSNFSLVKNEGHISLPARKLDQILNFQF